MQKLAVAIIISAILTIAGCIHVMKQNWVVSQRNNKNTTNIVGDCGTDSPIKPIVSMSERKEALNSNGFCLLSWNVQKGVRKGWAEDFLRLSYNKDLLTIQEAYLDDAMKGLLQGNHHFWDLALAFEYKDNKTGVLTPSIVEPNFLCTFRNKEPIIVSGDFNTWNDERMAVVSGLATRLDLRSVILEKTTGPLFLGKMSIIFTTEVRNPLKRPL